MYKCEKILEKVIIALGDLPPNMECGPCDSKEIKIFTIRKIYAPLMR